MKSTRKSFIKNSCYFLGAIISTIALNMRLVANSNETIMNNVGFTSKTGNVSDIYKLLVDFKISFGGYTIEAFLITLVLFFIYKKVFSVKRSKKYRRCVIIPSILFSFFMVFGYSFKKTASWDYVFKGKRTFIKALISYFGYVVLFYCLIVILFWAVDRFRAEQLKTCECHKSWFTDNKKSIVVVAGIILIAWLPSLIVNCPGITNYDFFDMLDSFYGNETYSLRAVNLISPDVTLNNNNPVFQTLIAVACNEIAQFLGIPRLAVAMFGYVQAVLFALVLSFAIYYLAKIKVDYRIRACVLGLFALSPINANYCMATLKDTNFSFVFILYIICLLEMIRKKEDFFLDRRKMFAFSCISFLLILLRNNGLYILAIVAIVLLIAYRKYIKKIIIPILIPILLYQYIIVGVVFPLCKIAPGSKREALSIPFQQTARLIKEHGEEIPEEDKEIIDKVLAYDRIAELYTPELSDKVKATFKKDCTQEELMDYFKVWLKWMPRHLDTYVEATMSNCYGYFYPEAFSWITYDGIAPTGKDYGMYSPAILREIRQELNQFVYIIRQIPFVGMFMSIGFYTWILILMIAYVVLKEEKQYLLALTPMIVLILSCIAGPANTMMRYIYPLILCLPVIVAASLFSENNCRIVLSKKG